MEFLPRICKPEDAERFATMTPENYAAHKHAELLANPHRRYRIMAQEAGPTKAELAERIDDIEDLLEEALWSLGRLSAWQASWLWGAST